MSVPEEDVSVPPSLHMRFGICILMLIFCTLVGYLLSQQYGSHFVHPQSIDRKTWHVISPGMNESMDNPTLGRGTHVVDHALTVSLIAFHASDKLSLAKNPTLKELHLTLAPNSGRANIKLIQDVATRTVPVVIALEPTRFGRLQNQTQWISSPGDGKYSLFFRAEGIFAQVAGKEYPLSPPTSSQIEITGSGSDLRIHTVKIIDINGETLIDQDYRTWPVDSRLKIVGSMWGLIVGFAISIILFQSQRIWLALIFCGVLSLPSLYIVTLPLSLWIEWVERLYLGKTPSFLLGQIVFCLSWLPIFSWAIFSLPLGIQKLPLKYTRSQWGLPLTIVLWCTTIWLASREESFIPWFIGLLFVIIPARIAVQKGNPLRNWILWDIPVLALLSILGWDLAMLPCVIWRFYMYLSSVPSLRQNYTRAMADTLFLLLLSLPLALESLIRKSYLREAWKIENLSMQYQSEEKKNWVARTWTGECGLENAEKDISILYVGGSSTGGIKQFRSRPSLFFSAQAHQRLCALEKPNAILRSYNYGRGALDTHLIAQGFSDMLDQTQPDWVIAYIGVNDLLTQEHPLTRRQREDMMKNWRSELGSVQKWTSKSRLFVGTGLLFRTPTPITKVVPNVPTSDARINIASMIDQLGENQKILLVTEYIQPQLAQVGQVGSIFKEYDNMLQDLAKQDPRVEYLDVWSELSTMPTEEILVDSNHLTQKGNQILGELIFTEMQQKVWD